MRYLFVIGLSVLIAFLPSACGGSTHTADQNAGMPHMDCGPQVCAEGAQLRDAYFGPIETWPAVETTNKTAFVEMASFERPVVDRNDPLVRLGKDLFFDPILSESGQFACASCHHPDLAFTDGIRASVGAGRQSGKRNAPTLLDKADQPIFMWDGSAESFEHQALVPIANPIEMASDHDTVTDQVADNTD